MCLFAHGPKDKNKWYISRTNKTKQHRLMINSNLYTCLDIHLDKNKI